MNGTKMASALAVSMCLTCTTSADTMWEDDFESYADGTWLHDVGGWRGWDGTEAAGTPVTASTSYAGVNSVLLQQNSDVVQQFEGIDCGRYEMSVWTFVPPSSGSSFFILMSRYSEGGPKSWASQVGFRSGPMTVGGDGGTALIVDEWVQYRVEFDLTANIQTMWYGDSLVFDPFQWADLGDPLAQLKLEALDLFKPDGGVHYYDDIRLNRLTEPGDVDDNGVVDFVDLLALLSAWGDCPTFPKACIADFDCDGVVGFLDLLTLLAAWSP